MKEKKWTHGKPMAAKRRLDFQVWFWFGILLRPNISQQKFWTEFYPNILLQRYLGQILSSIFFTPQLKEVQTAIGNHSILFLHLTSLFSWNAVHTSSYYMFYVWTITPGFLSLPCFCRDVFSSRKWRMESLLIYAPDSRTMSSLLVPYRFTTNLEGINVWFLERESFTY